MRWKYLIIPIILMWVQVVYGAASTGELIVCEPVVLPNSTCQLNTAVVTCTNYTYEVVNKTGSIITLGNLTLLNDSLYYLNFSEDVGEYTIKLCNDATTQIFVERREDNMLAITIGLIVVIIAAGLLAVLTTMTALKVLGYGVALSELITLMFLLYARESNSSLVPLLRTNFYIILLLGGLFGLVALVLFIIKLVNPMDEMWQEGKEGEERRKWEGQ